MRRLVLVALGVAALLGAVEPAPAQSQRRSAPPAQAAPAKPETPPPAPEPPGAPYEKELLRLSEILGSLTFLRTLCKESDAGDWRARMEALLTAEGTTPGRRERLAGAYNRGFKGFALTYRACTPNAQAAVARYVREGESLSRTLAGRFGG
ncbi:TIGR02301 family protein [Salinarimonas soli]|uniref:TIGR02301 family protein n=1 Tax=Salinarimonas soli TaxID=1638099 RepID=A0A5B2VCF3_9HYPH|nr:TIGR02301 family protein [Salinarimonas soli]KAA2236082.1 TIGR02301 family protein [Salinarimonas soli]